MFETSVVEEHVVIQHACAGELESFNQLVCMYRERVIGIAYRMCGDSFMAEDAAQIAFLNAWQRLSQFKPGTSFKNWLYRIAINATVDLMRKEKPQVNLDSLPLAAPDGNMAVWLEQQERYAQVRKAILALPEASRSVLVLKEYEYLSYREIADILDIPIGTVMSRLNYARSLLARQLQSMLEAE